LEPDAEAWRKHRETLQAHLPFRDFELARPAADGGKHYISVSGLPVFDKAGRFIGYRGVARHITERKRAEEALRDMQLKLAHANRVALRRDAALVSRPKEQATRPRVLVWVIRYRNGISTPCPLSPS
jgi:hypothetical protein